MNSNPAVTARGLHRTVSVIAPWSNLPACLMIALVLWACGALVWCRPAQGAEPSPAAISAPIPGTPLDFDQAVKIAIHQSPYFKKSSLEIDIRRMDETDSRYELIPPLTFQTYYYVNHPNLRGYSSSPYSLSFTTIPYNPVGAYFTLQAQKLATQIAILVHLRSISKGLDTLGKLYLKLDTLNQLARAQQELINLARENLIYVQNRLSIGTATSLDLKLTQQELQLARGQQEVIALSRKRALTSLKNFLGLPSNQAFTPNLRDSARQVMGKFDPNTASLARAKKLNYELKIIELKKKAQRYNVRLAIAKVFPSILFNTQTPDPLSLNTAHGLYVSFGLQIPVWDGFKRVRNVSRQKTVLRQINAEKEAKEDSLEDKWTGALADIHQKRVALKNAQALVKLLRLKAHQIEIHYQSGEVPLPDFLEGRKKVLAAQKDLLNQTQLYEEAVLEFRELSGDLGNAYVHASSWQE